MRLVMSTLVVTVLTVTVGTVLGGCGKQSVDEGDRSLAIGLTEPNANLIWSAEEKPQLPGGIGVWRDRVSALEPDYYRLLVNWAQVQPERDRPPDWDLRQDGCIHGVGPCIGWDGVREQLRALRSQQRLGKMRNALVVFGYAPPWATERLDGCIKSGLDPRGLAISQAAVADYRRMVGSLLALAREEQVQIRYWSAWNEPNYPGFISPQRSECSKRSRLIAPTVYARLVRALTQELNRAQGNQEVVLGELAGYSRSRKYATSVSEFVSALPDDVVCAATVFGQHAYVRRGREKDGSDYYGDSGDDGSEALLAGLVRALDTRRCSRSIPVWITETGAGGRSPGSQRLTEAESLAADCRAMQRLLFSWYRHPRVRVAMQYTFRDDPVFPVGLSDATLTRLFNPYHAWRAWGGERQPENPAPKLPGQCS